MLIRRISILNAFQCTGSGCSFNCCRGWKVPVDHDMYMKYLNEKGLFGILLRCSIKKTEELTAFRSTPHGCPFWGIDHLCTLQKKYGTEYMPAVCIQFPRQLYNLGSFCEETLYLACPESARLFLETVIEEKAFDFTESEGSVTYETNTTNDDQEFLYYLMRSREELVFMLKNGTRFDSMAIVEYGCDAQNACLARSPLPRPTEYTSREAYQITFKKMNALLFNGFYHPSLRTISPFLYMLCKRYLRSFGVLRQIDPDAGEQRYTALKRSLYEKVPYLDRLLDRYYEYFLYTDLLDVFEDYSFSKHLLYGIAKTHMLWLFLALYARNRKQVSTDEIARVIAVYERRAPQIESALKYL